MISGIFPLDNTKEKKRKINEIGRGRLAHFPPFLLRFCRSSFLLSSPAFPLNFIRFGSFLPLKTRIFAVFKKSYQQSVLLRSNPLSIGFYAPFCSFFINPFQTGVSEEWAGLFLVCFLVVFLVVFSVLFCGFSGQFWLLFLFLFGVVFGLFLLVLAVLCCSGCVLCRFLLVFQYFTIYYCLISLHFLCIFCFSAVGGHFFAPFFYIPLLRDLFLWFLVVYRFIFVWRFGCSIVAAAFGGRFFAPLFIPLCGIYFFGF